MIPLSKSIANRLMILSLRDNDNSYLKYLENFKGILSDDISVCRTVLKNWEISDYVNVGESRTALIFLKEFASSKGIDKIWQSQGTLRNRPLDNTSQILSAKILCGAKIPFEKAEPYHVTLTRDVMRLWDEGKRNSLFTRIDETIWDQCLTMESILLKGMPSMFKVKSAEDVCLGYFLGSLTLEQIVEKFPTSIYHESNRPVELLKTYIQLKTEKRITTRDHRVIMAASFYALWQKINVNFEYPDCVNKSFPNWWDYLRNLANGNGEVIVV